MGWTYHHAVVLLELVLTFGNELASRAGWLLKAFRKLAGLSQDLRRIGNLGVEAQPWPSSLAL